MKTPEPLTRKDNARLKMYEHLGFLNLRLNRALELAEEHHFSKETITWLSQATQKTMGLSLGLETDLQEIFKLIGNNNANKTQKENTE